MQSLLILVIPVSPALLMNSVNDSISISALLSLTVYIVYMENGWDFVSTWMLCDRIYGLTKGGAMQTGCLTQTHTPAYAATHTM